MKFLIALYKLSKVTQPSKCNRNSKLDKSGHTSYGFSMIELLVVMLILSVLAVLVLSSIDTVNQIARSKDAGRITNVLQLGRGLSAYYVARNGQFPAQNNLWISTLKNSKEIANIPENPSYSLLGGGFPGCGTSANEDDWCYATSGSAAVTFAPLNAKMNNDKCSGMGGQAYTVYATRAGRSGIMCAPPQADETGQNFIE